MENYFSTKYLNLIGVIYSYLFGKFSFGVNKTFIKLLNFNNNFCISGIQQSSCIGTENFLSVQEVISYKTLLKMSSRNPLKSQDFVIVDLYVC